MNILHNFKTAFKAVLILSIFFSNSIYASFTYEGDGLIGERALGKIREMGEELHQKTGVSTVIIAKKHLSKKEFLDTKNRYLKELKDPYVLWIFSKTYMDREKIGINQMFNSESLNDKFDQDSLFSPWGGTFAKVIVIQKSDSDPTAAAFLNGYGDLVDMISSSYGVTLNSSIGNESKTAINYIRIFFYATILFFLLRFIKMKYFTKEEN